MKKSKLLLLETILSVLIFSVCLAVCVSLFSQSHITNRKCRENMRALTITESAQNILSNKDITELSDFWNGKITENSVTVFFDENLDSVTDEYIYTLNITKDGDEYTFTVSTDKEIISSTTLTIHKPLIREVTS